MARCAVCRQRIEDPALHASWCANCTQRLVEGHGANAGAIALSQQQHKPGEEDRALWGTNEMIWGWFSAAFHASQRQLWQGPWGHRLAQGLPLTVVQTSEQQRWLQEQLGVEPPLVISDQDAERLFEARQERWRKQLVAPVKAALAANSGNAHPDLEEEYRYEAGTLTVVGQGWKNRQLPSGAWESRPTVEVEFKATRIQRCAGEIRRQAMTGLLEVPFDAHGRLDLAELHPADSLEELLG